MLSCPVTRGRELWTEGFSGSEIVKPPSTNSGRYLQSTVSRQLILVERPVLFPATIHPERKS
jgi:hypothetical protein